MEAYKPSKADYFWNMSGCLASAMASLLLVIGVTRIMGTEAGGIFSLAFSLGQLLMMLGNMGLRTYQVSDLEERYSMGEYVVNRIISCALMMLCTCVYGIATRCSGEKFAALLLIVGTKMIDAFADVFEGQLQKDASAGSGGHIHDDPHGPSQTLLCLGLLMVTRQLMVACGCMFGRGFLFGGVQRCPGASGASSARRVAPSGDFFAEEHCAFCAGHTAVLFVLWFDDDCGHAQIRHRFFNDRVGAGHLWHFVSARTGRQSAFKLHFQTADCGNGV